MNYSMKYNQAVSRQNTKTKNTIAYIILHFNDEFLPNWAGVQGHQSQYIIDTQKEEVLVQCSL